MGETRPKKITPGERGPFHVFLDFCRLRVQIQGLMIFGLKRWGEGGGGGAEGVTVYRMHRQV